jgi:hypothetical protein
MSSSTRNRPECGRCVSGLVGASNNQNENESENGRGEEKAHTGRVGALDEFAHDLVVEELDVLPLHALGVVLLLLAPHGELDEDLLQALVHVVDAELLE